MPPRDSHGRFVTGAGARPGAARDARGRFLEPSEFHFTIRSGGRIALSADDQARLATALRAHAAAGPTRPAPPTPTAAFVKPIQMMPTRRLPRWPLYLALFLLTLAAVVLAALRLGDAAAAAQLLGR